MGLTTVDDVAEMLRWSAGERDKYEDHLDRYIDAASLTLEAEYGPFESVTLTHTADGGATVELPKRVNSVTGVTVDGVAVTGYTVYANAGVVVGPFAAGRQNVVVTYTSGFDTLPADVVWAATALVVHMWNVASQRVTGLPEDYTAVPVGFLIPNVVKEALRRYKTMPGFA